MDRIVGCFCRDQRPVTHALLEGMLAHFKSVPLQAKQVWCEDSVGFGWGSVWENSLSPFGSHLNTPRYRSIQLVADARLDNQSELIDSLGLDRNSNDHQIIVSAYQKWGPMCTQRLLGDFAFALWDRDQRQLFCARDHLGVKPLYYYIHAELIGFASEIRGLFAIPTVPRQINDLQIARYLVRRKGGLDPILDEDNSTLYQDIYSLPAAHWMVVTPDTVHQQCYWQLDPEKEISLCSHAEYAEAFREIFSEAVRCRMGDESNRTGVLLSGGLDSSAVACTARQYARSGSTIPTFSAIFPHLPPRELRVSDERGYLNILHDLGGFESHLFEADRLSPLRDGDQIYTHPDECLFAPNFYIVRTAFQMAKEQGVRVMLDGFDGDVVVSHGIGRLREIAQAGQWFLLAQQMGVAKLESANPWRVYWNYLWAFGLKPRINRGPLRQIWATRIKPNYTGLISPELVEQTALIDRIKLRNQRRARLSGVRGEHLQGLISGLVQIMLATVNKAAVENSIDVRHPFLDRRLVEFCLALPSDQKLDSGWTRVVLRRSMAGILPDAIRWRPDKANLSPSFCRGLLTYEQQLLNSYIREGSKELEPYLSKNALVDSITSVENHRKSQHLNKNETIQACNLVWSFLSLDLWLRRARN